jgi:hypothetical protein
MSPFNQFRRSSKSAVKTGCAQVRKNDGLLGALQEGAKPNR